MSALDRHTDRTGYVGYIRQTVYAIGRMNIATVHFAVHSRRIASMLRTRCWYDSLIVRWRLGSAYVRSYDELMNRCVLARCVADRDRPTSSL